MRFIESTIFNDLKTRLTQISTAYHYFALNISETVQDKDIVAVEYSLTYALLNGEISSDRE